MSNPADAVLREAGFIGMELIGHRWFTTCGECGASVMIGRPHEEIQGPRAHRQWHVELSRALGLDTNA